MCGDQLIVSIENKVLNCCNLLSSNKTTLRVIRYPKDHSGLSMENVCKQKLLINSHHAALTQTLRGKKSSNMHKEYKLDKSTTSQPSPIANSDYP